MVKTLDISQLANSQDELLDDELKSMFTKTETNLDEMLLVQDGDEMTLVDKAAHKREIAAFIIALATALIGLAIIVISAVAIAHNVGSVVVWLIMTGIVVVALGVAMWASVVEA